MSEVFILSSLKIDPVTSPIQEPVKLSFEYALNNDFKNWKWVIKYTVDIAFKRIVLDVLHEKSESIASGKYTKDIIIPKISTEGIADKDLLNVGLLTIYGISDNEEMIAINMVSQITKNEKGELYKTLLSPLE